MDFGPDFSFIRALWRNNKQASPGPKQLSFTGPQSAHKLQNKHSKKHKFTQILIVYLKTNKTRPTEAPQIYKQTTENTKFKRKQP